MTASDLARRTVLASLRLYKLLLSPLFAGSCRFVPSCSDYATEAVSRYGVVRGTWLAARRLGRCHPLGSSGYDPVPLAAAGRHEPATTTDGR
ncbi:MAG: membrane protein insertion efficiency factor YidD [Acidobacteria bacterium]|nr:membrane protein insertion efficiency factor YidD [Acidobacteriota bacterium]